MSYLNPYALDELLLHKVAPPPSIDEKSELERIASLDVKGFKEADVREEIINPLLKIIGYKKGNEHSVDREKHIKFVGSTNRYIDYSLTVWEQDFWLVETKRPHYNQEAFGYKEASQAFEYAAHPEIRAALVVICDGIKLEIFDREESVENPAHRLLIKNLAREYINVAQYLSPVNVWFFYRRRLLRELDRAFEKEGNLNRVTEFKGIMSSHLDGMRSKILSNFRANSRKDENGYPESLALADPTDITESLFFVGHSHLAIHNMNEVLLKECRSKSIFHTMYRLFPDEPRDANDFYFMHATDFLIRLEASDINVNWAPSWLGGQKVSKDKAVALQNSLPLFLSHFEGDDSRRVISLVSSAYRRIAKILAVTTPQIRKSAEFRHLLTRLFEKESTWKQILSSPERNMIFEWERVSLVETSKFVKRFSRKNEGFKVNSAKQELIRILNYEVSLLDNIEDYKELVSEAGIGEAHPTEFCSVSYDNLGHGVLCILEHYEKWRNYVLSNHRNLVEENAKLGSWAARKILGEEAGQSYQHTYDKSIACRRFFFGDEALQERLNNAYGRI
ncbi:type I restriction enzyme HsdR N-terminal domain-containing protein [Chromohalobacter israelensis]|uniref:type I restriction enzyme HsdR N-terminal domain-containing protein n=1 Tax=Chromohalobacter israelensis TaxID=141390 RepID=UPI000FFEEB43|nr:type I restriction enzyme HsdR N-terminal domain-containing protein [Chromohalobacter salexigens]RXE49135.1 hypothetical protein B4O83_14615 [Chromohalobacter salexigens]